MINKKVSTEIAIGIIIIIATTMGALIWFQNNNLYASSSETRDKVQLDASSRVVFLGDSITAQENWNALFGVSDIGNAGVSGDTTSDVISRLDTAILYKPQKLFLMIGINDLFQRREVSFILANYELILDKIKLQSPDTIIYIQSVLPINSDLSKNVRADDQKIIALNEQLKVLAEKKKSFFIDLYPAFCGPDHKLHGKYTKDGVHLAYYGYLAWKKIIGQYVQ